MRHVRFELMARAFVFVNVEANSESEVLKRLREVPEVREAYVVYGVYDIIVKVETDSMDHLKETIAKKVRKLGNIRSTITTVVIEGN